MSIQEILGKDPKRWKYAECTEILNGNTTPEQKQTASDRQASIKAWLRSKEDQNKPSQLGNLTTQKTIELAHEVPIELPTATEDDLKYSEGLLAHADRIERLAVYRLKKKHIPLRGDIVNAERNYLIALQNLRIQNS